MLESAIQNADAATEFSKARVLPQNDLRLVIVAGVPGLPVAFGPTPDDPTTVVDLQLDSAQAQFVGAVLSGPLDPFPTIQSPSPECSR
jgi:hypothetical protein